MKKKILSLLLCLSMISVFVPAFAGSGIIAKIGNTEYTDYSKAWQQIQIDGGTIDVLADWLVNENLIVPEGKLITINMNGHNIKRNLAYGTAISNGQIFLVQDEAELVLNGGTKETEHKGTVKPSGLWVDDENGRNSLYGGLISGGANGNGGGAIQINEAAKVTLNDLTVAGNWSFDSNGGGAIRLEYDDSELVVNNSRICYNISKMGGGGAIRIEGENAHVEIINNSSIDNNVTTRSNSDGGAIQINEGGSVRVDSTSQISYNTSTRRGGGIYLYEGSLTLEDGSKFTGNVAKMEGGALYIDEYAADVKISSDFIGNHVEDEEGGAIYINDESEIVVENANFISNAAKTKGGAIYVDTDDCFSLAGKCEMYQNTPNNLFITDEENLTSAKMFAGSRVGIFIDWDATATYYPVETTYSDISHFVSDKENYKIAGGEEGIYYVEAQNDGDTTVPEYYVVDGVEYELKNGTFTYNSDLAGNIDAAYFYSDGYFAESSVNYNEHLSTMSVNLTLASATTDLGERAYTEELASENIRDFMEDIGYSNMQINYTKPAYYGDNASPLSTIGYLISSKEVNLNGSEHTIVAMTVRSAEYADEWASNVTLGDGNGEAEGFSDAATQVFSAINKYVEDYNIDTSKVKFWLTGYSRGGATANIVSKRLTDMYGGEKVYGYTFEAPKGGVKSEIKVGETYSNIHNVINKSDIVPYVGPSGMGFIRYGHDVYVPGYSVGTPQYEAQKVKMLAQLSKLDPDFVFDDYFHEASIEYFGSTLGYYSLISENYFTDYDTAADWIPFFLDQFQMRSMTDEEDDSEYNRLSTATWGGFRHYYSDHKWFMKSSENGIKEIVATGKAPADYEYSSTFEQAIANVMQLYYSMPNERKTALMNCFDAEKIMAGIDTTHIWMLIVDEWDDLSYSQRNKELKDLWNVIGIENIDNSILSKDEKEVLRVALPVILDVLLDFVAEDYDHNDQDGLGTLVYNISNILLSHYYAITCSWLRSYDSFYALDYSLVPIAPEVDTESGIYDSEKVIKINKKENTTYYYTLDGSIPNESSNVYTDGIILSLDEENPIKQYTLKIVAVKDGVSSEVSTFTYILSETPIITTENGVFKVNNLKEEAVFVVASYSGNKLSDIKLIPVSEDKQVALDELNINTTETDQIKAFLFKDLSAISPLCGSVSMNIVSGE